MRYMGGKYRQSKALAEVVGKLIQPGMEYYEPFCGAMGSAMRCVPVVLEKGASKVHLSDYSESLITMWRALLSGWEPPEFISEEDYTKMRAIKDPKDPLTALVGFGAAFGGKWFGTFARHTRGVRNIPEKINTLLLQNKVKAIRNYMSEAVCAAKEKSVVLGNFGDRVVIERKDYKDVRPKNALLYLDPPYAGRTNPYDAPKFNHTEFWEYARALIKDGNIVLVTEFVAPEDFVCVYSWGDTVVRHYASKGSDGTNESIYMCSGQANLIN